MVQKGSAKIRKGLKQALDGAKEELTKSKKLLREHLDSALEELDKAADKVMSDDDIANVVKGARSLAHRGVQKVADLLKDKKEPPDSKKK